MAIVFKKKLSPFYYFSVSPNEAKLLGLKSRTFSTTEKSRKGAEAKLKLLYQKIEIIKKQGVGIKANSAYSFLEIFELYKTEKINIGKPLSQSTLNIYNKAFDVFIKSVGNKFITEFTRNDYYLYTSELQRRNYAQNTKAMLTNRIYAIFSWSIREGFISYNPIKNIAESHVKPTILTDNQVSELLNYAQKTKFFHIIKFMILSAFRVTEALNLKFSDITPNSINVVGKGNKSASIPLTSQLKELIDNFPKTSDKIFDFDYDAVRQFFNRASSQLNIKMKSHDMRKYCISKLANSGVNIFYVKTFARHSDIKTTLKYYAQADEQKLASEIDEKVKFFS